MTSSLSAIVSTHVRPERKWPRPPDRLVRRYSESEFSLVTGSSRRVHTAVLNTFHCSNRCTMCGFFRDTLNRTPNQYELARQLDQAFDDDPIELKLYNSGSFFDDRQVPPAFRDAVIHYARRLELLTVEAKPFDPLNKVLDFQARLGRLELALGIEVHDSHALALLNKPAPPHDFPARLQKLKSLGVWLKAYVLVGLPFFSEAEAVTLTARTIAYCRDVGFDTVSLLATTIMPGFMERLQLWGLFRPLHPRTVFALATGALSEGFSRVFVNSFSFHPQYGTFSCPRCISAYRSAFRALNQNQVVKQVECPCLSPGGGVSALSPLNQALIASLRPTPTLRRLLRAAVTESDQTALRQLLEGAKSPTPKRFG